MNPKFSIIVPHYDGVISDEMFIEGMKSLDESTFRDFEVLIYHDGPVSRPLPSLSEFSFFCRYRETKTRYDDWGHSLRDLGIKEASGDYIIHFNPDNILYPNILEEVSKLNDDIIICPVILEGTYRKGNTLSRTHNKNDKVILDGFPPVHQNIDAMQLIMKTSLWRKYGGWFDKSEQADGIMYQVFCEQHIPRYCGSIIGEHR